MRGASKGFRFPMAKTELLPGVIYIPVHAAVLAFLVPLVMEAIAPAAGAEWTELVRFAVSALFILVAMHSWLGKSFSDLIDRRLDALTAVVAGYFGYYLLRWLLQVVLWIAGQNGFPPLTAILDQAPLNGGGFWPVTILLAPLVEEVLFRGVVFGALRRKNRLLAYLIAFLVFAVCSVWSSLLTGLNWGILRQLLACLPASLALCWCYELSSSIWAPVLLHILLNVLSVSLQLGV